MRFRGQLAARPLTAFIAASLCALGLSACSAGPLADVASLSPAIQGSAVNDNDAFVEASDQILLTNILRARDREPLNVGMLASVNGALSLSGTAGFTIPFGSKPAMSVGNSFAPSITGSTSPTYSFTPLNSEGFTLNILQPVSAAYVLSRWNAGISRELLLLLFVKEIDFPEEVDSTDPTNPNKVVHYVRYLNNPDDEYQFDSYLRLVNLLLRSNAALKSFDIMDPVGPKFDMYSPLSLAAVTNSTIDSSTGKQTGTNSASPSQTNDMHLKLQPNSTSFGEITGNSDGQYHFGNDPNAPTRRGQLYRVYAGQVALCVNAQKMSDMHFPIPSPYTSSPLDGLEKLVRESSDHPITRESAGHRKKKIRQTSNVANVQSSSQYNGQVMLAASLSGGTGSSSLSAGGTGTKSSSTSTSSSASGASQATTAALQAQRISSIINDDGCGPGEIVLKETSEDKFSRQSQAFVRIQWRSIAEIFEYLGAVLRLNRSKSNVVRWLEPADSWVAVNGQTADSAALHAGANTDDFCAQPSDDCNPRILFNVTEDGPGYLSVNYRNTAYSVADVGDSTVDQTKTVLAVLSSLVNIANVSSGITPTTPLQLLPLP